MNIPLKNATDHDLVVYYIFSEDLVNMSGEF